MLADRPRGVVQPRKKLECTKKRAGCTKITPHPMNATRVGDYFNNAFRTTHKVPWYVFFGKIPINTAISQIMRSVLSAISLALNGEATRHEY